MLKASELKKLVSYLKNKPDAALGYPHSKTLGVFSVNGVPFAYLETRKPLMRLSLRSDTRLAKLLREKYEEVSAGQKLDPRTWNTIIVSGQLSLSELTALIDHSYSLALEP